MSFFVIKLNILSNKASPGSGIGSTLGQKGVNLFNFCKMFNNITNNIMFNIPVRCFVYVFSNKQFLILIKKPLLSYVFKRMFIIEKMFLKNTNIVLDSFGLYKFNFKLSSFLKLSNSFLEKVISIKFCDFNTFKKDKIFSTIIGTLRSYGFLYENLY